MKRNENHGSVLKTALVVLAHESTYTTGDDSIISMARAVSLVSLPDTDKIRVTYSHTYSD
jgi:hypothetical protein